MKESEWVKEAAEEIRRRRAEEPEEELIRRAERGQPDALKKVIDTAVRRKRHEEAEKWMQKFFEVFAERIAEGDAIGAYEMVYHNGPRVADYREKREEELQRQVVKLLEKLLKDGKEEVRAYLDRCYYREINAGKRKIEDVIGLWKELAESGDAKAEWMTSSAYASLTDNEDAAREWLEKSARHGYAAAQYAMAESYITVDEQTNEYAHKEAKKAIPWLKRAAAQCEEPMGQSAMLRLGDIYQFGCKEGNVRVDYKKAIQWYTLAAQYGNCYDKKEALIKLADCYGKSRGANRDAKKSAEMFELLANEGLLTEDEND